MEEKKRPIDRILEGSLADDDDNGREGRNGRKDGRGGGAAGVGEGADGEGLGGASQIQWSKWEPKKDRPVPTMSRVGGGDWDQQEKNPHAEKRLPSEEEFLFGQLLRAAEEQHDRIVADSEEASQHPYRSQRRTRTST